jgi:hypothetical protein
MPTEACAGTGSHGGPQDKWPLVKAVAGAPSSRVVGVLHSCSMQAVNQGGDAASYKAAAQALQ